MTKYSDTICIQDPPGGGRQPVGQEGKKGVEVADGII